MKNLMSIFAILLICHGVSAQRSYWCSKPNAEFCSGNFFTNGDFETITNDPNAQTDNDITLATGWSPLWGGTKELADLHCPGGSRSNGTAPSPNSGVYAGIWIENRPTINKDDALYREGMYNKLKTAIMQNTGSYTFNFKIANAQLSGTTPSNPVVIGLYGVYNPTNVVAPKPNGSNDNPTNINLWTNNNSVKVVLLGTVTTPTQFTNQWLPQSVTFNSSSLPTNGITHIMVTSYDAARPSKYSKLYINFDEFCLQKSEPPITFDPCCPPMNSALIQSLFKFTPGNTMNGPYKIAFNPNSLFLNSSQAYANYIKTIDPNVGQLVYSWELFKAGTGTNPIITYASADKVANYWNAFVPGNNGPVQSNFFPEQLNPNQWYRIHVGVYTEPSPSLIKTECSSNTNYFFRVQVTDGKLVAQVSDGQKIISNSVLGNSN